MENKKIVGLTITTDILLGELDKKQIGEILVHIEEEIDYLLHNKFKAKVISGKGGFLYEDKNNKIVKQKVENERKIKLSEGEIESFFCKGERNPCDCGSNLYHHEFDGEKLFGVCNACNRDIYEFNFDESYIKNSDWKDKE